MTPELREQTNWLLDSIFDTLTAAMADGRYKTQEEIKTLIDQSPLFAEESLAFGLVDALGYEDTLVYELAKQPPPPETEPLAAAEPPQPSEQTENEPPPDKDQDRPKATLRTWREARGMLLEKPQRPSRQHIGVISLTGTITMGPSRQPPIDLPLPFIGGAAAGEETLIQLLRQAEADDQMAALIFHIDSGGGAALASDLIWRQLDRIAQKKPVLAYLGNMAASGGYYIAAAASHIMAQPLTLTGSIGVIMAHISTADLFQKIQANRVSIARGKRAGLYSDDAPLTAEERNILWAGVVEAYQQFKKVVANGRDLPLVKLDAIAEGRVWTGEQALGHRLIDSYGDFRDAIEKAAELANIPTSPGHDIQVVTLHPQDRHYRLPQPFEAAEEIARLLSAEQWQQLIGRPLLMLPYRIKFW
jgi:protease-4